MNAIFIAACIVLLVVPVVFVMHSVYQDGFFGRVGLLGVAFSSATFLGEWATGTEYEILPQTVLMVSAFAVFLCWHLFRFHRRVLRTKC
jgi:hypothetical protein